jgi:hypothetical protein
MFPGCVDLGGGYGCTCNAASCGAGGSCDFGGKSCRWTDSFDDATEWLTLCSTGTLRSSWARGAASGPTNTCHNGVGSCWATGLYGSYNTCELSCLWSPGLALAGVTGTIDVSFLASYSFERSAGAGYDGATVRFRRPDGTGGSVAPDDGWDTTVIRLGGACPDFAFPSLPGWGQYATSIAQPYEEKRFRIDSTALPEYFYDGFLFRIWAISDESVESDGIYIDDLEVVVTQSP